MNIEDKVPITQEEIADLKRMDSVYWNDICKWNDDTANLAGPEYLEYESKNKRPDWIDSKAITKVEVEEYWEGEVQIKKVRYFWNLHQIAAMPAGCAWARKQGFKIPEVDE